MKTIISAFFALLLFVSCSATRSARVGSAQPNIVGTTWTLADNVKGIKPTLVIESGKVNGNAGCNNYFGTLSLDPTAGNFSVTNTGATKKMCENMTTENNYLKMLNEADKYVVSGNTLELYKGKLLLMKFTGQ